VLEKYRISIYNNISSLENKSVYLCVNDTPWQYHFEKENYVLLEDVPDYREEMMKKHFIKLSRRIGVEQYELVPGVCRETFNLFLGTL
jgi:hypothetical protein